MSIQSNIFCWHGITTNLDQGGPFYTEALGWSLTPEHTCVAPGGAVAHLQAPENGPPAWCTFLAVDDLDASTTKVTTNGGHLLVPPTALPVGRFSVVTTPSGAMFGLYESGASDAMAKPGPGSIRWVELQSTAPEHDVAWFGSMFGFTHDQEGPVAVLKVDGQARAGVRASESEASRFVAWVEVADMATTLEAVTAQGGTVLSERTSAPAVGRRVLVADPSGATFGLVQPG